MPVILGVDCPEPASGTGAPFAHCLGGLDTQGRAGFKVQEFLNFGVDIRVILGLYWDNGK